jgi:hypothetical protein
LEEFSTTNGREIEASAADLSEGIKYAHEHALDRKRKLEAVSALAFLQKCLRS